MSDVGLSGHPSRVQQCPLLGVKRTLRFESGMSAYKPICDMGDPNLLRYTTAVPSAFLSRSALDIFGAGASSITKGASCITKTSAHL